MTSEETITLPAADYNALVQRCDELEDILAAIDADNGVRVPHAVALAIIGGSRPMRAFRDHLGLTLSELSERTGLATSYLSEIERGRKELNDLAEAAGRDPASIQVLAFGGPRQYRTREAIDALAEAGADRATIWLRSDTEGGALEELAQLADELLD